MPVRGESRSLEWLDSYKGDPPVIQHVYTSARQYNKSSTTCWRGAAPTLDTAGVLLYEVPFFLCVFLIGKYKDALEVPALFFTMRKMSLMMHPGPGAYIFTTD